MFVRGAIFVLVIPLQLGLTKNNYDIILEKLVCRAVSKVNFLNCQIHRQRSPVASAQLSLNETIHDFEMHIIFDLLKKDKTRMNVADLKLDGCKYLEGKLNNNIVDRLLKNLRTNSSIPKRCPALPGKLYEIRNYTFNSDVLPARVPQSKWQNRLKFLTRSQLAADILFEGTVVYNT